VLTLGILGVAAGAVLTIVAALNRAVVASSALKQRLDLAILAIGGVALTLGMTAILESTFRSGLHRANAYRAIGIVAPLLLIAFARVSRQRWAATIVAGTYMTFMVVCIWLFPLFPAEPKLGPVYQPITHFIPLQFPMLVIAPAFASDLILARWGERPRWQLAPLLGVVFVVVLVAVQWPFADFLMSEHARNRVFGTHYMPYMMHPDWHETRFEFFDDPALVTGLLWAVVYATGSALLGLLFGDALRRVKR
jgi:phosphoglycerol transferase MdoB-like AlkP superfamily enzyme